MSSDIRSIWTPEVETLEAYPSVLGTASGEEVQWMNLTHVLYISFNSENFGHFLTDEMFPIYTALQAFGLIPDGADAGDARDVQLLRYQPKTPIGDSCDYRISRDRTEESRSKRLKRCERMYQMMTPIISKHPVIRFNDFVDARAHKPLCFKKLVLGLGLLADHCQDDVSHGSRVEQEFHGQFECNSGRQKLWWDFRSYAFRSLGSDPTLSPESQKLLIWKKEKGGRRYQFLSQFDSVRDKIKTMGIDAEIYPFEKKTMREQMEAARDCTVFLTTTGGGSHVALFMPRGSTVIRFYGKSDKHMEKHLFAQISYTYVENVQTMELGINEDEVITMIKQGFLRYKRFHS